MYRVYSGQVKVDNSYKDSKRNHSNSMVFIVVLELSENIKEKKTLIVAQSITVLTIIYLEL